MPTRRFGRPAEDALLESSAGSRYWRHIPGGLLGINDKTWLPLKNIWLSVPTGGIDVFINEMKVLSEQIKSDFAMNFVCDEQVAVEGLTEESGMRQAVEYAVSVVSLVVWLAVYLIWSNDLFQFWKTSFRFLGYEHNAGNYAIAAFIAIASILILRPAFSYRNQIFILSFSALSFLPSFLFHIFGFNLVLMHRHLFSSADQNPIPIFLICLSIFEIALFYFVARYKSPARLNSFFALTVSWSILIRVFSILALAVAKVSL